MNLILYTLITTHITIVAVTLYLHRSQTHLAVTFNPVINHFFRFWLRGKFIFRHCFFTLKSTHIISLLLVAGDGFAPPTSGL